MDFDPRYIETDDGEIRMKMDLENRVLTIYCYSDWRYSVLEGYNSLEEAMNKIDEMNEVRFKLKTCSREEADFIEIECIAGEIRISTKYCKLKWFTYNDEWRELLEYLSDKMTTGNDSWDSESSYDELFYSDNDELYSDDY